jgi:hypothetical protein
MLWRRGPKAPPFDKAKAQYEGCVKRCYGDKRVVLALCKFRHFTGFNVAREELLEQRRHDFISDNFENPILIRSVAQLALTSDMPFVRVKFVQHAVIGGLILAHMYEFDLPGRPQKRREEQELVLKFSRYHPTGRYREALWGSE